MTEKAEGTKFTPEQIAKGELVTEYYKNLPPTAPASPPEPIFKDLIRNHTADADFSTNTEQGKKES